jgi:hypothetical protein
MRKTLAIAFFLSSCGNPTSENLSHVSYGTFTPGWATVRQWSAYTTIEENGCSLPMVIEPRGIYLMPSDESYLRSALEESVRTWTKVIHSQYWPCADVRVAYNAWGIRKAVRIVVEPDLRRAYALPGAYEVHLGLGLLRGDPYGSTVILHEMGHMFGLADTYTEPGYQQPLGQPPAVMNNLYLNPVLTEDDIDGANNLYEYMNGRAPFCAAGYVPGAAYENLNRVAFCVRS